MSDIIVEMRDIVKRFGGITALSGGALAAREGEVHALLGDNGAGKSTLIKVLCGIHQPDSGEILIDGKPVAMNSTRDARIYGIETVHQDLALVDDFSAVDNLFLGREPRLTLGRFRLPIINQRKLREDAIALLNRGRIKIKGFGEAVFYLSGGQRQGVAISRAISDEGRLRVLVMDEPTAALGVEETGKVLDLIKRLRDQGVTIIVISHNLHDVFAVADRATVMYGGRRAVELVVSETTSEEVVSYIMGAHTQSKTSTMAASL